MIIKAQVFDHITVEYLSFDAIGNNMIYLDNAATTPVLPEVSQAMLNPSTQHLVIRPASIATVVLPVK